ncbi:hypothetical protein TrLO_g7607 [Triparma laevis f. longispina]|uniref:Uncharacterized protein n=1 Tax=Triparma laevis f. longispina TaxID=1714387 RepID=A0A9W7F8M0_9STRA|nr:hypothetical protein TrLO_g7607 [Triparma laevis f. longispina]
MLTPQKTHSTASLRWNASRHQESLSSFLRENVILKERVKLLEGKGDGIGEEEVTRMIGDMKVEMEGIVKRLEEELNKEREENRSLKGDLEGIGGNAERLLKEIEVLKVDNKELLTSKTKLSQVCEEVKIDCDALKGEKIILLEQIEELRRENERKGGMVISLNEEIIELTSKGGDHAKLIADIDAKYRLEIDALRGSLACENLEVLGKLKAKIKKMEIEGEQIKREKEGVKEMLDVCGRKCERLELGLEEEKKGRKDAEIKFKVIAEGLRSEIDSNKLKFREEEERLNEIIEELREEIRRLIDRPEPEPPQPEGSKFGMFVDLKSKNKELEQKLRKEKERVVGVGGLAGRRRSMRGGGRGVGVGGSLGNQGEERTASAKDERRGSRYGGRKPEEVMF